MGCGGGEGGLGGLWGFFPLLDKGGGICSGILPVFLGGVCCTCGCTEVGTGVVCEDPASSERVWNGGTCFPLPLDMGGVGIKLASGTESLELPGSVLV